jgi:hypothetical protein
MVQRSGKNSVRRSFSFSCPATSTAGAMRADVGELGSRADVIKIEWPPHGDGCRGRDQEFADSPLEGDGFELSVPRVMGGRFRTTDTSGDRGFRAGQHGGCDPLSSRFVSSHSGAFGPKLGSHQLSIQAIRPCGAYVGRSLASRSRSMGSVARSATGAPRTV